MNRYLLQVIIVVAPEKVDLWVHGNEAVVYSWVSDENPSGFEPGENQA